MRQWSTSTGSIICRLPCSTFSPPPTLNDPLYIHSHLHPLSPQRTSLLRLDFPLARDFIVRVHPIRPVDAVHACRPVRSDGGSPASSAPILRSGALGPHELPEAEETLACFMKKGDVFALLVSGGTAQGWNARRRIGRIVPRSAHVLRRRTGGQS